MNIIDAIQSGKKFKRIIHPYYMEIISTANFQLHYYDKKDDGFRKYILDTSDMVAYDWQLEEESRELKWSQIYSTFCSVLDIRPHRIQKESIKIHLGFTTDEDK